MSLGIGLPRLAKPHNRRFKSGLVDLAIALDDVDLTSSAVGKHGDLPGALVPAHCHGRTVEHFNKDDCLVRGHGKAIGKGLAVKCFAPLLKYVVSTNATSSCTRVHELVASVLTTKVFRPLFFTFIVSTDATSSCTHVHELVATVLMTKVKNKGLKTGFQNTRAKPCNT
jgi:hypothetical protein